MCSRCHDHRKCSCSPHDHGCFCPDICICRPTCFNQCDRVCHCCKCVKRGGKTICRQVTPCRHQPWDWE